MASTKPMPESSVGTWRKSNFKGDRGESRKAESTETNADSEVPGMGKWIEPG